MTQIMQYARHNLSVIVMYSLFEWPFRVVLVVVFLLLPLVVSLGVAGVVGTSGV